jgi:hypothetical protein
MSRISSSSLPLLSVLVINVHRVLLEDIQVLGTLPALRHLELESDVDTTTEDERAANRLFMLSPDAFPRVLMCSFQNVLFAPYMFPLGAMPMVQSLCFGLLVSDVLNGSDWDLCIRNLPALRFVLVKLYGEEESSKRYSDAAAVVERGAVDHPNRPEACIC